MHCPFASITSRRSACIGIVIHMHKAGIVIHMLKAGMIIATIHISIENNAISKCVPHIWIKVFQLSTPKSYRMHEML